MKTQELVVVLGAFGVFIAAIVQAMRRSRMMPRIPLAVWPASGGVPGVMTLARSHHASPYLGLAILGLVVLAFDGMVAITMAPVLWEKAAVGLRQPDTQSLMLRVAAFVSGGLLLGLLLMTPALRAMARLRRIQYCLAEGTRTTGTVTDVSPAARGRWRDSMWYSDVAFEFQDGKGRRRTGVTPGIHGDVVRRMRLGKGRDVAVRFLSSEPETSCVDYTSMEAPYTQAEARADRESVLQALAKAKGLPETDEAMPPLLLWAFRALGVLYMAMGAFIASSSYVDPGNPADLGPNRLLALSLAIGAPWLVIGFWLVARNTPRARLFILLLSMYQAIPTFPFGTVLSLVTWILYFAITPRVAGRPVL